MTVSGAEALAFRQDGDIFHKKQECNSIVRDEMKPEVMAAAENFITNETEFHLGFLPTEQSNPLTRSMEADFRRSTVEGVATLQKPDRDVLSMVRRVLVSEPFARMAATGFSTVRGGGRIIFSGCGATGRLSILLESMWREYFSASDRPELADCAASIMTGGDYALVKSVEAFEDYQNFGRRQAADLHIGPGDMLVAITEGGETSSVIGTVKESAERGAAVFLLFNNPAGLLREKLVRCREVIDDPRVTVLDLFCGPMALAGSTRMQATTSEQLVAGVLLESVAAKLEGRSLPDFVTQFEQLLDRLESAEVRSMIAQYIDFEADVYASGGRITYLANDYLLDIFTDTTERSPTFMLPPFRRRDDMASPMPWAFVKNPLYPTRETWRNMLHREVRCLAWRPEDYRAMGAPEKLVNHPPAIDAESLYGFEVGCEPAPERFASPKSGAVIVEVADSVPRAQTLSLANGRTFTYLIDPSYRPVREMRIQMAPLPTDVHPGDTLSLAFDVINPYAFDYTFGPHEARIGFVFRRLGEPTQVFPLSGIEAQLPAQGKLHLETAFVIPAIKPTEYQAGLTIYNSPASTWFNSAIFPLRIE